MKKVAFGSDFHVDITQQDIIGEVKNYLKNQQVDIFCFAGDMSASIDLSAHILKEIEDELGIKVLAVPGNHEMWDTKNGSSFEALLKFNKSLPTISVMEQPYQFGDWAIVGNMGWYNYSTAPTYYHTKQLDKMKRKDEVWQDKNYCDWHGESNPDVADYLLQELTIQLEKYQNKQLILLSHIVPYADCITVKNDSTWNYFNAFIGNRQIGYLADKYQVKIAHFGHTHERHHKKSSAGVEMVCSPLGYYGEWTTKDKNIQKEIEKCIPVFEIG